MLKTWRSEYSLIAVFTGVFILLFSLIFFNKNMIGVGWIFYSLILIVIFFLGIALTLNNLHINNDRQYIRWLFWTSFGLRVFFILFITIEAEMAWGLQFYVGAKDEIKYDRVAWEVATLIRDGRASEIITHVRDIYEGIDDVGFPTLIGLIYAVFGKSLFIGRAILALFGSYSVVLIYKIAVLFWEDKIARLASILAMWFPLSLFYNAVYLKEGLLVFMVLFVIYKMSLWIKYKKIKILDYSMIILVITSMFLFRTALGALMVLLVVSTIVFTRYRGSVIVGVFIGLLFLVVFYYTLNLMGESRYFEQQLISGDEYGSSRLESITKINKLASLGSLPVFLAIAFFTPFPTLVSNLHISYVNQPHGSLEYQIPGILVWNLIAFFAIVGLIQTIRNNRRETMMIWGFSIGYTFLLIKTALLTSVRFAYCGLPIMLIFAAVGISQIKRIHYWYLYLFVAFAMVIGWNYFKIIGRGL